MECDAGLLIASAPAACRLPAGLRPPLIHRGSIPSSVCRWPGSAGRHGGGRRLPEPATCGQHRVHHPHTRRAAVPGRGGAVRALQRWEVWTGRRHAATYGCSTTQRC